MDGDSPARTLEPEATAMQWWRAKARAFGCEIARETRRALTAGELSLRMPADLLSVNKRTSLRTYVWCACAGAGELSMVGFVDELRGTGMAASSVQMRNMTFDSLV